MQPAPATGLRRVLPTVLGLWCGLGLLAVVGCSGPPQFLGTVLTSESEAAPFDLRNQYGEAVSLSDSRGRVVALTFLYTNCPDICPLTTTKLRDAYEALGDDSEGVSMLVISVDPERDDVESALEYSKRWGMEDRWDFLTGERHVLSEVWRAYFVAASVEGERERAPSGGADGVGGKTSVEGLRQEIERRYLVSHSAPVYLIDRDGVMRVAFTLAFEAEDLAHDITLLLEAS